MTQNVPTDTQIRTHPIYIYGGAIALGISLACGMMVTGLSLFGKTIVSKEEIQRTERALEDARKQIDSQTKEIARLKSDLSRMEQADISTRARLLELQEQITKLQAENNRLIAQVASIRDIAPAAKTPSLDKTTAPITAPSVADTSQLKLPHEPNRFFAGNVRCRAAGASIICEIPIINTTSEDYQLLAFVKQQGGMRNVRYDSFGISKLYDDQGGEYPAMLATLGNRNSPIEGQGEFTVLSDSKPTLSLRFDGVPTRLITAKRVHIAMARKLNSGPESLEVNAKNISIEGR